MNLYELTQNILALTEMFDNAETDDELQTAFDTFESVDMDYNDKMEGFVKYIKNIEALAEAKAAEIKRLQDGKKALENRVSSLKRYMLGSMNAIGQKKVNAGAFTISVANNGGMIPVVIENEAALPEYLLKFEPKPDMETIRKYLDENGPIDGLIRYGERGQHLAIR